MNKAIPADIASKVRALMEANCDRPIDLHRKSGMAVSSISRILNAEFKRVPQEQLSKIAEFYGEKISYFLEETPKHCELSQAALNVFAALKFADQNNAISPEIAAGMAQLLRSLPSADRDL